ncbi:hypothetical protein BLOT_000810 [Blomia tropicalis]|nr:hypothetical protein BLOT_000810 [Blomia tropicalis]
MVLINKYILQIVSDNGRGQHLTNTAPNSAISIFEINSIGLVAMRPMYNSNESFCTNKQLLEKYDSVLQENHYREYAINNLPKSSRLFSYTDPNSK